MVSPRGMSNKIIPSVSLETVTITFPSSSGQQLDANPMTVFLSAIQSDGSRFITRVTVRNKKKLSILTS
jgi:hypothetical protein